MQIQYKGVNIDLNGSTDTISAKGITSKIHIDGVIESLIHSIRTCYETSQFFKKVDFDEINPEQWKQLMLNKLKDECSHPVDEFVRRRKIEEKWNGRYGNECNIEYRFIDHKNGIWLNFDSLPFSGRPTWLWNQYDYRVKEEEIGSKSEYQRRLAIERAWNGKLGPESNIECTNEMCNGKWGDKMLVDFGWEVNDYRVKKEEEKKDPYEQLFGITSNEPLYGGRFERSKFKLQTECHPTKTILRFCTCSVHISFDTSKECSDFIDKFCATVNAVLDDGMIDYEITTNSLILKQDNSIIELKYKKGE